MVSPRPAESALDQPGAVDPLPYESYPSWTLARCSLTYLTLPDFRFLLPVRSRSSTQSAWTVFSLLQSSYFKITGSLWSFHTPTVFFPGVQTGFLSGPVRRPPSSAWWYLFIYIFSFKLPRKGPRDEPRKRPSGRPKRPRKIPGETLEET